MCRALIALILLLSVAGAHAKIYKWVMPDGSIQYSDRPQEEGAKEMELPPLQIFSAPRVPASPRQGAEPKKERGYDSVRVVSPKNNEAIRDNAGTVSVTIALEPALQPDHTIEILMDGKPIGSGRGTSVSVTNVDRGTHSVSAVVKDAEGGTVASAPGVTFHLQRARVRPRPAPR